MKRFLYSSCLMIVAFSVPFLASDKPVQREIVNLPVLGKVEITAWEKDKDVPRIIFRSVKTRKLLREIEYRDNTGENRISDAFYNDRSQRSWGGTIHFRVMNFPQGPGPLVVVTGVMYGGSDGSLITYIVGENNGNLEVMNTTPFVNSYQGGTFVGNLGRKYGFGAVVWNFIWQEGYAHYATHPFDIEIFSYDRATKRFISKKRLRTKKLYYYGSDPSAPLQEHGISGRDLLETLPRLEDRRGW